MVRLTDRPDMTLDVYRGRKTTMHQDPPCKMDLDFQVLFRKGKIGIIAKLHRTDLVI